MRWLTLRSIASSWLCMTTQRNRVLLCRQATPALVFFVVGMPVRFSWAVPTFYPLPMSPSAVSADGSVVVGTGGTSSYKQAFRWTADQGTVDLGVVPGIVYGGSHTAKSVSGDGSVVIGSNSGLGSTGAWKWTSGTGTVSLASLSAGYYGAAYGISEDGSTVVGRASGQGVPQVPCRWTSSGLQPLPGVPAGWFGHAQAASADGGVIVGSAYPSLPKQGDTPAQSEAFRYTDSTGLTLLSDVPGGASHSEAQAVSADGRVIVGIATTDNYTEPFRWTAEGSMISLGRLACNTFRAQQVAVNGDGSIIVGWAITKTQPSPPEPGVPLVSGFIWDRAHGMRDFEQILGDDFGLDLSNWGYLAPTGISADGRTITGTGYGPEGQLGWVVVIPEPATLGLGLLMLIALSRQRRFGGR